MNCLAKVFVLSILFWAGIGFSTNQDCFNLIQEPVRICATSTGSTIEKGEISIYDLDRRILLASFEGSFVRNVSECFNCSEKLNHLITESPNHSELISKLTHGHADLSFLQFTGFTNSFFNMEFGSADIGGTSYPYIKAKKNYRLNRHLSN